MWINRRKYEELERRARYLENEIARLTTEVRPYTEEEVQRSNAAGSNATRQHIGRAYEYSSRNRYSVRTKAVNMLNGAKGRAKKKGLGCDLTVEWILDKLDGHRCEVTGIQFDFRGPPKGVSNNRFAPSLDRIDSDKGYTKDNVQVVVWQYNAAKSEYTTEEFIELARVVAGINTEVKLA